MGNSGRDSILGGYKITVYGDCSHEIKRHWFFGRKVMTNLDSILKSRDITLPTKVHLVFLVVMYGYESWTIKKAECWRIAAFELCCWRRLLRVPWTTRWSTQSSVLAWRIPGMWEHRGLLSMGSHRVRHDWSDLAAAAVPLGKNLLDDTEIS